MIYEHELGKNEICIMWESEFIQTRNYTTKSTQDILWTETTYAYTVVYFYHTIAFPNKNKLNF